MQRSRGYIKCGSLSHLDKTPDLQERGRQRAIRQTNQVILFRNCGDANSVSVGCFYKSAMAQNWF